MDVIYPKEKRCLDCLYDRDSHLWLMAHKKHKLWRINCREELASHPLHIKRRLIRNVRNRLREILRKNGNNDKVGSSVTINCSPRKFKEHLESKFTKEMTWQNYGKIWQIDHIKPLSKFKIEELYCANYYTNLQPLTNEENRKKRDYYENPK